LIIFGSKYRGLRALHTHASRSNLTRTAKRHTSLNLGTDMRASLTYCVTKYVRRLDQQTVRKMRFPGRRAIQRSSLEQLLPSRANGPNELGALNHVCLYPVEALAVSADELPPSSDMQPNVPTRATQISNASTYITNASKRCQLQHLSTYNRLMV
jgi:hypothetical protein